MQKPELMPLDYGLLNRTVCNWRFGRQSPTEESPFYRYRAAAVIPEKRDKCGIKCHELGERCYPGQSHANMQANSKWQIHPHKTREDKH
jgi:hypothetical protein